MRWRFVCVNLVAFLFLGAGPTWAKDECASCHEVDQPKFAHNAHAQAGVSCRSCHGDAPRHREDHNSKDYVDFKDKKQFAAINAACLKCHTKGQKMMYWEGSEHQSEDVSCSSCHDVHTTDRRRNEASKCMSCHSDVRRDTSKFSHHPIKEGKMECSSCHDVHGSPSPSLLRGASVNDLCYTCHTEKRGPFRFAHSPVEENCLNCHKPHGSTAPRLLAQPLRNTCTNCHVFGRKNNLSTENIDSRGTAMTTRGSCTNCHGDIHGSNTDFRFR